MKHKKGYRTLKELREALSSSPQVERARREFIKEMEEEETKEVFFEIEKILHK
jgi:hypothetical protein